MKQAKFIIEQEEERPPFFFLKKSVSEKKIKASWQKIKEKIEPEMTKPIDNKENNNLL